MSDYDGWSDVDFADELELIEADIQYWTEGITSYKRNLDRCVREKEAVLKAMVDSKAAKQ